MVYILDLPDETIGRILDCFRRSTYDFGSSSRSKWETLANLNLTCRRLSALCTPRIWERFRAVVDNNVEAKALPTAMARIRDDLGRSHLLSPMRRAVIYQRLPDLSDEDEEEDEDEETRVFDNATFFQALSELVRGAKGLRSLSLSDFPVDSTKIPQSYNDFWISVFASDITEISYKCSKEDGKWIDPDLVPHMAKSRIQKLELDPGKAHETLSCLSTLSNLPEVNDLSLGDWWDHSDEDEDDDDDYSDLELDLVPPPKPFFWQGMRRLTLHNLHKSALLQVVEWVRSSRLEAGQDAPSQTWGLEYLAIDLEGTRDPG